MTRNAFAGACAATLCAALAAASPAPAAAPPGYTVARTGGPHDFDPLVGAWTVHNRRLKTRGVGSNDWTSFDSTLCVTQHLQGGIEISDMYTPSLGRGGVTIRAFDKEKKQWTSTFVNEADGQLQSGVVGGFEGPHGELYGEDTDGGRPIKARAVWTYIDPDHARWEQAFSYDDRTWETNWVGELTRADPSAVCDGGRTKR